VKKQVWIPAFAGMRERFEISPLKHPRESGDPVRKMSENTARDSDLCALSLSRPRGEGLRERGVKSLRTGFLLSQE
jgi:hypothetical protein